MLNLDLVAFDLGVEGGDFRAQQTRGLTLASTCLYQRAPNQFRLEAAHFSLQVDRVVARPRLVVFGGRDFAQQRQSENLEITDSGGTVDTTVHDSGGAQKTCPRGRQTSGHFVTTMGRLVPRSGSRIWIS